MAVSKTMCAFACLECIRARRNLLKVAFATGALATVINTCVRVRPLCTRACRNLLKVVFATGTLAAGINMPARTTVISALGRMTDDGPQLLPHNELLQMAGRAGRRGFDTAGYCVILQTR